MRWDFFFWAEKIKKITSLTCFPPLLSFLLFIQRSRGLSQSQRGRKTGEKPNNNDQPPARPIPAALCHATFLGMGQAGMQLWLWKELGKIGDLCSHDGGSEFLEPGAAALRGAAGCLSDW